jgi:hypothetical protein
MVCTLLYELQNKVKRIAYKYLPNTAKCTPNSFNIGIICFPFVIVLKTEGFKQSPLKIKSGFRKLNFFTAVANPKYNVICYNFMPLSNTQKTR